MKRQTRLSLLVMSTILTLLLAGCLPKRLEQKHAADQTVANDGVTSLPDQFDSNQQVDPDSLIDSQTDDLAEPDSLLDDQFGSDAQFDGFETQLPPDTTITKKPEPLIGLDSASVEFICNKSACTFECKLDDGGWEPCSSPKSFTGLSEGSHTVYVRAVYNGQPDPDPAIASWSVDTTSLLTTITQKPTNPSYADKATFVFECNSPPCTFQCNVDGKGWETCTSGKTYTDLQDGTHQFLVKATDGNQKKEQTPKSWSWSIDTSAPLTTISLKPAKLSNDTAPEFEVFCNKPPCTFSCRLDDGQWEDCSPKFSLSDVSEGEHTILLKSMDSGSNEESTPVSYSWNVDLTAPKTIIEKDAGNNTFDREVTFEFSCDTGICQFECAVDDGVWAPCFSPATFSVQEPGSHKFSVRATDEAGNLQLVSSDWSWTLSARWRSVSAGSDHTCAVMSNDTLWCWGANTRGQLGNGESGSSKLKPAPIEVGASIFWKSVSSGEERTCAITQGDELYCWGRNDNGQVGNGSGGADVVNPAKIDGKWSVVSTKGSHSCGIQTDGALYCWGYNGSGQLGNGTSGSKSLVPVRVGSSSNWLAVDVGGSHTCAIEKADSSSTLWCWGANFYKQVGGENDPQLTPKQVGSETDWKQVQLGTEHSCAVRGPLLNAEVYCWGRNNRGQIANGESSETPVSTMHKVASPTDPRLSVLGDTTCYSNRTTLVCAGNNEGGQLVNGKSGTGEFSGTGLAISLDGVVGWSDYSVGRGHICSFAEKTPIKPGFPGAVVLMCWGANRYGELGIDDNSQKVGHLPTKVHWPY